jgi:hypothetical protein
MHAPFLRCTARLRRKTKGLVEIDYAGYCTGNRRNRLPPGSHEPITAARPIAS